MFVNIMKQYCNNKIIIVVILQIILEQWFQYNYCLAFNSSIDINNRNDSTMFKQNERILSRKRRYLIFPEGSSFQLVFCLTMPTWAIQGNLFTIGLTASLAWELPHDPYAELRKKAEAIHRRKDNKTKLKPIYIKTPNKIQTNSNYSNSHIKYKYYVTKKPIYYYVKPESQTFNSATLYNDKYLWKMTNNRLQKPSISTNYHYYDEYQPEFYHIHRRIKRDLLIKIEKFLNAQRLDGRACILKALCEVSQMSKSEKGSFIEAIMRVVFTWNPDPDTTDMDYQHYNKASTHLQDCSKLYKTCETTIFNLFQ